MGVAGRFTGLSLQDVNAHGQAQIDGWVGLFIMGFALQMFPPVWHARLAGRRWRLVPLGTMLAGVVLRSVAMSVPLGTFAPPLALLGSGFQVLATALFAAMLLLTFHRSLERIQPWMGFVFLALACFVAQALFDGWHTWRTQVAPSREALLAQVSTFQAPLRDLQIHGLALCMILAVSQRFFPPFLGVPETRPTKGLAGAGGDRRGSAARVHALRRLASHGRPPLGRRALPRVAPPGRRRGHRRLAVAAVAPAGPERPERDGSSASATAGSRSRS